MRERKPYPNISDEELDRRAEEALKRMLANPQKAHQGGHGQPQNHGNGNGNSGNGNAGGGGGGGNNNNQNRRRHRRRPK
jgi:hypothetical protein